VLTDVEKYAHSGSRGESDEESQGIFNSITGRCSRFSEAAENTTESFSSFALEEMVHGVCDETEPTSFENANILPKSIE